MWEAWWRHGYCARLGLSGEGRGHCVVILSRTLYCLHPGVLIGTGELNAGSNPAMTWYPAIHGGVEILLVDSCYRNRDKLWPDGPLGDF